MRRNLGSVASLLVLAIALLLGPILFSACQTQSAAAPTASKAPAATPASGASQPTPPSAPATPAAKPSTGAPSSSANREVVKTGYTQALTFAPLYVAIEKGYYAEQGIDVQLERFAGGADYVSALGTGQLDTGFGAISAGTYNAFDRGVQIKIVAPMGIMPLKGSAVPLVVRKALLDSGQIKEVKDLKGRKIAVNTRGASTEYMLTKALEKGGLTLNDVNEVPLDFSEIPLALDQGAVDAGMIAEPFAAKAVSMGVGKIFVAETVPGKMTTVLFYSNNFMKDRPEIAKRFIVATMKGARDIQGKNLYSDDNMKIYIKHTGLTAEVIKSQTPYMWDPNLEIQVDSVMDQQQVHIANGLLKLDKPIAAERMIDASFVNYALDKLGKVIWEKY